MHIIYIHIEREDEMPICHISISPTDVLLCRHTMYTCRERETGKERERERDRETERERARERKRKIKRNRQRRNI